MDKPLPIRSLLILKLFYFGGFIMKMKISTLFVNSACEGCQKNCKFRGLTSAEKSGKHPYGCNTSR